MAAHEEAGTTTPVKSEFQIFDDADSKQIQEADTRLKQALVYESKGKRQLSYMGIKWIVLKMSQNQQALEILDMPQVELIKHDENDRNEWIWYATVKVRNAKTGLVTIGASEQAFLDVNSRVTPKAYDQFGRTKAISKAERNAFRKQIPELEINTMMEQVESDAVQRLDGDGNAGNRKKELPPASGISPPTGPTREQREYIKQLDPDAVIPATRFEAIRLISRLRGFSN